MLDLQAADGAARAALWEFVFGVDLVVKIIATNLPIDEPLRFMLADPRQLRTDFVYDSLWVLPLDVAALLSADVRVREARSRWSSRRTGAGLLDGGPGASCPAASTPRPISPHAPPGAVVPGATPGDAVGGR